MVLGDFQCVVESRAGFQPAVDVRFKKVKLETHFWALSLTYELPKTIWIEGFSMSCVTVIGIETINLASEVSRSGK